MRLVLWRSVKETNELASAPLVVRGSKEIIAEIYAFFGNMARQERKQ